MSADIDFVREYVGDDPTDEVIEAVIDAQGSPEAAAHHMLRKMRATMLSRPGAASVEGYSYNNGQNLETLAADIDELGDVLSDTGGTIDLVRPDVIRGGISGFECVDGF